MQRISTLQYTPKYIRVQRIMLRCSFRSSMKYAKLELTTRGEFPHGMKEPGFVKKLDKNIPWYFSTYRSMYHWPVAGDNWSDLDEGNKHHDLHMFYTLAWWKLGEGIFDADDDDWYQEFEMHHEAKYPFNYAREAPNTSVFPQFQLNFWMFWGFGRQELWIDRDTRRYETFWEMTRRFLMWFFPCYFIFPFGIPKWIASNIYGEYGEKPFLDHTMHLPLDNNYIEWGGNSLDAEWLRHIHSKESF